MEESKSEGFKIPPNLDLNKLSKNEDNSEEVIQPIDEIPYEDAKTPIRDEVNNNPIFKKILKHYTYKIDYIEAKHPERAKILSDKLKKTKDPDERQSIKDEMFALDPEFKEKLSIFIEVVYNTFERLGYSIISIGNECRI